MKEKLKIFLEYKNLTAAQMADQIGAQRSSFSHILNGRNKPSADFISKMLQYYPELNANWLFGMSDNMLLTQRIKNNNHYQDGSSESLVKKDQEKEVYDSDDNKQENKSVAQDTEIRERNEMQEKKAIKVVYFYDDFTFTEYFPG